MKKMVVIGAGESGFGAAVLAQTKGFDVLVSDNNAIDERYKSSLAEYKIRYEENGHTMQEVLAADEIIKSPEIGRASCRE
ncbi:MAG TPA: hypothetical protein VJ946_03380, partial [Bacteroidales bacterium]|nr:hypothetical protein [Bacteroidales bacterium]